jgi:hypothetical protein
MVSRLRGTVALDHGKVRQTFDVLNCPGLTIVCESQHNGDDFEPLSQVYQLSTGETFDNGNDALLAWDAAQSDREIMEALGETLLRYRHGTIRPLWSERRAADKAFWITGARAARRILNDLGFDIVRMERANTNG